MHKDKQPESSNKLDQEQTTSDNDSLDPQTASHETGPVSSDDVSFDPKNPIDDDDQPDENRSDNPKSAMEQVLKKFASTKKNSKEDELEEELAQTKDKMMRIAAEAENIRKRAEREKTQAHQFAVEKFSTDLLPVADNFQRALDALDDDEKNNLSEAGRNLLQGVAMVEKELQAVFQRHGLQQIHPQDMPFNPEEHQAVAQIPSTQPANDIVQIAQVGYKLNGRVLRPAMVIVSAGPPNTD